MKAFDPFRILDVTVDATKSEIKKAYRKKSLETHPDKNKDDPLASSKFLQVTRAYKALTDEAAIENYKKYGNPDGPGTMKVAIGLPYFLMKKENQILSLCISFLFILVVIPSLFLYWYSGSYLSTDKSVNDEDGRGFAMAINENITFMDIPKLVGWASDFNNIKVNSKEELELLSKLNSDILHNKGPSFSPKDGRIMQNFKPNLLIMFYMFRGEIPEYLRKQARVIIEKVPNIIDLLLEISMSFHVQYRMRRSRKNMSFKAMVTLINFNQHLIQGLWEKDSQLLQLPHMDADKISKIGKKLQKKEVTLKEYTALSKEDRASHGVFSESELKSVEQCISNIPNIDISAEIMTEGSEDIVVLDVVSIKIKLTRKNLKEGEKAAKVCSRTYPFLKDEVYYVYLTDIKDMAIFSHVKFRKSDHIVEETIKFQAQPQMIGKCKMRVHCYCDSYIGVEAFSELDFEVKQSSETRTMYSYHEDDIKREPTLFEQVLQGMNEVNSDDDLEEEEDNDDKTDSKQTTKKVHDHETFDSKKNSAKVQDEEDELSDERDD